MWRWVRGLVASLGLVAAVPVVSCSTTFDEDELSGGACEAGTSRRCFGPGDCAGRQECGRDRTWGDCACGEGGAPGAGGAPSGGAPGSGGSSDGGATIGGASTGGRVAGGMGGWSNAGTSGGGALCTEGFVYCDASPGCIPDGTCCDDMDCPESFCPAPGGSCDCPPDSPVYCTEDQRCHPDGTCCNDSQCPYNQECSRPGGVCACPEALPLRCDSGACYTPDRCCGASDCPSNMECWGAPGGLCVCANGLRECEGSCIPEADCCTKADCSGVKTCQSGSCQCPSDKPVVCGDECYASCCPGQPAAQTCGNCGFMECKSTGDGWMCQPTGSCDSVMCTPPTYSRCQESPVAPGSYDCSGCF